MFVPRTQGGQLVRELQKEEDTIAEQSGYRVKLVEKGGTRIGDILVRIDPFGRGDCMRGNCFPCLTKHLTCKWVPCWGQNITYMATCFRCKEAGVKAVYHGESCKSLQNRAASHMEKLKGWDSSNFMLRHNMEYHLDEDPNAETTCGR